MNITIFGGAKPKPGVSLYEDALKLGSILGKSGHTVLTGGYCGVMEAASRGFNEAGGHVIGVTCVEIEDYRSTPANQWVKEEWKTQTLTDRINKMIDNSDAIIAMPGGVGTLTEIMVIWNRMLIGAIKPCPIILVGTGWSAVMDTFFKAQAENIHERDKKRLSFVETIENAAAIINHYELRNTADRATFESKRSQ